MITLVPRRITTALAGIAAALIVISIATGVTLQLLEVRSGPLTIISRLFDLRREQNIPTWFSSCMLLLCGLVAGLIGAHSLRERDWARWYWVGLAVIFTALSVDELASIHEYGNGLMRLFMRTSGLLYYGWVIPGMAIVVAFGLSYLRFWLRLPTNMRLMFFAAGLLFLGGSLGIEMIGALLADIQGDSTFTTWMATQVEESLEIAGLLTLLHTLMSYVALELPELTMQFVAEQAAEPVSSTVPAG
jgi:hypothetical protein